jgi:hypothetical protein
LGCATPLLGVWAANSAEYKLNSHSGTTELQGSALRWPIFISPRKEVPLCRSTRTLAAAIIATVLAVIHPAAIPAIIPANLPAACIPAIIPAIIPANLPAAWVSIRPVTRVRVGPVILRLVRLIVGDHITVIGRITISMSVRGAVTPARIAGPATAAARIRFIRLHTQCCQNKRGCESNITQLH